MAFEKPRGEHERGDDPGPDRRRWCAREEDVESHQGQRMCVLVPGCTENVLRFSARLDEGAPEEARFERIL